MASCFPPCLSIPLKGRWFQKECIMPEDKRRESIASEIAQGMAKAENGGGEKK